ncbi:hypothetical protein NDU88_003894 [Pleurodeles waltl]|uniref:Uncharacterized protein n=1 Tax=Pleurodeles waltl TaxID=8319 RepID=A0AAV7WQQ4_PLEWA|nr:hypothetical protein NDU88_003894 [Pleurodeles waltl]
MVFSAIKSQQHRAVSPERAQHPTSNKQGRDCPSEARAAASRAKRYTAPPATHLAAHHPSNNHSMHCPENPATAPKLPVIMTRGMHGRTARTPMAAVNKRVGWKADPNQPDLPAIILDPRNCMFPVKSLVVG